MLGVGKPAICMGQSCHVTVLVAFTAHVTENRVVPGSEPAVLAARPRTSMMKLKLEVPEM